MRIQGVMVVKDLTVTRKSGSKNGKEWEMFWQSGLVDSGDERRKIQFMLPNNSPLPLGNYQFSLDILVDKYGRLEIGREWKYQQVK